METQTNNRRVKIKGSSLPYDISPRDIRQWLECCYFVYRTSDGDRVCGVDEDLTVRDIFSSWYKTEDELILSRMYPHWPLCGSINVNMPRANLKLAAHLNRRPLRQYSRSYNTSSLGLSVPDLWEAKKRSAAPLRIYADSKEVIEAAFFPQYYNIDTALDMLYGDESCVSVAINPNLIIGPRDVNNGLHTLHSKGVPVAFFNRDLGKITPAIKDSIRVRRLQKSLKSNKMDITYAVS